MGRARVLVVAVVVGCGFDASGRGGTEGGGSSGSSTSTTVASTSSPMTTGTTTTQTGTTTGMTTSTTEATGDPPVEFGPWATPVPVLELDLPGASEDDPTLTGDQLEIYFSVLDDGDESIHVAVRSDVNADWESPQRVVELDVPDQSEGTAKVRADGLVMLLFRVAGGMDADVFISSRASRSDPWATPTPVTSLNGDGADLGANPNWELGRVVMCSDRLSSEADRFDIFETTFDPQTLAFATPVVVNEVSEDTIDCGPHLSADGLTLWFFSDRPDADRAFDLYTATRPSLDSPFAVPIPVDELNTDAPELDPWLSEDGRTLYFVRDLDSQAIWTTTRDNL